MSCPSLERKLLNAKAGALIPLTRQEFRCLMDDYVVCQKCGNTYLSTNRHACVGRDPLLQEREKTHGSFTKNASAWNDFMQAMRWASPMKAEQTLVLHMIFVKLSRAIQNPNEKDHWRDIAGYAKLGEEACDS